MDEPRKGLAVLLKAFEILAPGPPGPAAAHRRPRRRRRAAAQAARPAARPGGLPRRGHRGGEGPRPALGRRVLLAEHRRRVLRHRHRRGDGGRACRSSPATSRRSAQVLRGGRAGELFATGDAADLAKAAGAAARRPGPPRRAVGRRARRGGRLRLGRRRARRCVSVYETVVLGRASGRRSRGEAVMLDAHRPGRPRRRAVGLLHLLAGQPPRPAAQPGGGRPHRARPGPGPARLGGLRAGLLRAARPGHQPAARRRGAPRQGRRPRRARPGRKRPDPGAARHLRRPGLPRRTRRRRKRRRG